MLFSKTLFMMLFHTKYHFIVTGTTLNITEQEIVDVKRNFRLHPHYTIDQRSFDVKKLI